MVTLRLALRVPESIRWTALEPDQKDLGDVCDNVKSSNENKTAADFGICLKRPLGSDYQPNRVGEESRRLTALSIHLNQECGNSNLSYRNGNVEKENRDPGEEKEIMKFSHLYEDGHMVSKAV